MAERRSLGRHPTCDWVRRLCGLACAAGLASCARTAPDVVNAKSNRPPRSPPPATATKAPIASHKPVAGQESLLIQRTAPITVRLVPPQLELTDAGERMRVVFPSPRERLVLLDDHRPRRLPADRSEVALKKLLTEDLELAPGRHQLLACETNSETLDCQGRAFVVGGPSKTEPLVGPLCVLLEPGGTYWQGDSITLFSLAISAAGQPESVSYRVRYPAGESVFEANSGEKLALELPPGDTFVELRCAGSSSPPVQRLITINPFAAEASSKP